jgi:hypothetical protein
MIRLSLSVLKICGVNEDHKLSLYKLLCMMFFFTSFRALVNGYPNVEASPPKL